MLCCRRCIHGSGSAMVVWCGPATEAHGRTTPATKRCGTAELSRATGRAACSALTICSSPGSCGCGAVQADMTSERLGGLPPRPRHTASPLWLLNSAEQAGSSVSRCNAIIDLRCAKAKATASHWHPPEGTKRRLRHGNPVLNPHFKLPLLLPRRSFTPTF